MKHLTLTVYIEFPSVLHDVRGGTNPTGEELARVLHRGDESEGTDSDVLVLRGLQQKTFK